METQKDRALSVILPTKQEAANLENTVLRLRSEVGPYVDALEILVIDADSQDGTDVIARKLDVKLITLPDSTTFGDAIRAGVSYASHEWVLTMDADGSHEPAYVLRMLRESYRAHIVVAARYVPLGGQQTSWFRDFTSRLLNHLLRIVCSIPLHDITGGFKLYHRSVFDEIGLKSDGFEIQAECIIKAYGHGFVIKEIPFHYRPRREGKSKAKIIKYGWAFIKSMIQLRNLRNSIAFADYDERAFNSRIPLQKIWQRTRFNKMMDLLQPDGLAMDVGCGTGRLILTYPKVIGLDIEFKKLRYLYQSRNRLIQGDCCGLPFQTASLEQIFCCEVLEHLGAECPVIDEFARILKPGGKILITTPDYGRTLWPFIEMLYRKVVPGAYGDSHISKYDLNKLKIEMSKRGFQLEALNSMFGSVLIALFKKERNS